MKKSTVLFGILFICILLLANFVFAEIIIGDSSGDLETNYGPGDILRGWINISIINESINSSIYFFDQNITLLDFLRNNSVTDWNCTPSDCSDYYNAINGNVIKTFDVTKGNSKVIGLLLKGMLSDSVNEMHFNVSTDAPSGCSPQLKIDIAEDNDLDWVPLKGLDDYSCTRSSGDYNPSEQLTFWRLSPTTQYCEKIKVPAIPSMQVGADIVNTGGTGTVTMNVYYANTQDSIGSCDLPAIGSSGEYYCNINNIGFFSDTDIYVCIKGPNNYEIKGENAGDVSGFYDLDNHVGFTNDYSIFVKGGKYDTIGSFRLDKDSFKNYIQDTNARGDFIDYLKDYLSSKYENNCQNNCVIPIKFIAGENQQITLSDLDLEYGTLSGNLIENKFYDLDKRSAKLNSGFLMLDLQAANFTVPTQIDNISVAVRTENGDVIVRKEIQIKELPQIEDLVPRIIPALVATNFIVTMDNAGNITYIWDFGDNSSKETTNKNSVSHTYSDIGNYVINIKASNINGETSRTFGIEVVSPKDLINSTIFSYRKDIANFENEISIYPAFIKTEIEKSADIENIKESINAQEKIFSEGYIDDNKAIQIMSALVALRIPNKIFISKSIKPSVFYMNRDQLDLERLTSLGAGKEEGTFDDNYNKINSWMREKISITVESKSYSVYFRDKNNEPLFSDVKFTLIPKERINEMYFIVNGNADKVKFSEDINAKTKDEYTYINLNDLSNSKTIEFLYPEVMDPLNLPVVISPAFADLPAISGPSECNLNKICEKELGENSDNCSDCKKSWIWIVLIGLSVLIIVFFIVYIILQEWYKRYYESHLFKDRNHLFNLINFINNSELQGVSKNEVFKKLRDMKWSGEQLTYAYNKLHGKRTGMWEIPIFKGFEKKEIRRELMKRQKTTEGSPSKGENPRAGMPPNYRRF